MDKGAVLLWPERESLYFLKCEELIIGTRAFQAEKQLQPYVEGESYFQKIYWYDVVKYNGIKYFNILRNNKKIEATASRFDKYYALDPAGGGIRKANSAKPMSESARVIGLRDRATGHMFIDDVIMDRAMQSTIIREMYDLHNLHRFKRMAFEDNLFRELHGKVIDDEQEAFLRDHDIRLALPIEGIHNNTNKDERIKSLEPMITRGELLFYVGLKEDFKSQLRDYPNCDRDDGLDALEILMQVSNPDNRIQSINTADLQENKIHVIGGLDQHKIESVNTGELNLNQNKTQGWRLR